MKKLTASFLFAALVFSVFADHLPRKIKNTTDPIDRSFKIFYRNKDDSTSDFVWQIAYSCRAIKIIGKDAGLFRITSHFYGKTAYSHAENREEEIVAPIAYISGFDLSEVADGDVIDLKDGQTLWRIGVYREEKVYPGTLPRFTVSRAQAQEYIAPKKTRKKKQAPARNGGSNAAKTTR